MHFFLFLFVFSGINLVCPKSSGCNSWFFYCPRTRISCVKKQHGSSPWGSRERRAVYLEKIAPFYGGRVRGAARCSFFDTVSAKGRNDLSESTFSAHNYRSAKYVHCVQSSKGERFYFLPLLFFNRLQQKI